LLYHSSVDFHSYLVLSKYLQASIPLPMHCRSLLWHAKPGRTFNNSRIPGLGGISSHTIIFHLDLRLGIRKNEAWVHARAGFIAYWTTRVIVHIGERKGEDGLGLKSRLDATTHVDPLGL